MMGRRGIAISYEDRLLFWFLGGVIGGTVIANLLCGELQSQIGFLYGWEEAAGNMDGIRKGELWLYVLRQRSLELLGLWLVSQTAYGRVCFQGLFGLAGMSVGGAVTFMTVQKGVAGLPLYAASIFPQYLCYIPVCILLAVVAGKENHGFKFAGIAVTAILWMAGTLAEAYL